MVAGGIFLVILGLDLPLRVISGSSSRPQAQCKAIPGDEAFPEKHLWDKLNVTVGGRLIATAPVAGVCHGEGYDKIKCSSLKQYWDYPQPQSVQVQPCARRG